MKLGLQIVLALVSLIPLYFAVTGVVLGPPDAGAGGAETDNQFRYLSAYYLSFAFGLWYVIADVERRGWVLRFILAAVFLGGLARAWSVMQVGEGNPGQTIGMYVELASPLLLLWQALVARKAG